jgi:hypothetical protein
VALVPQHRLSIAAVLCSCWTCTECGACGHQQPTIECPLASLSVFFGASPLGTASSCKHSATAPSSAPTTQLSCACSACRFHLFTREVSSPALDPHAFATQMAWTQYTWLIGECTGNRIQQGSMSWQPTGTALTGHSPGRGQLAVGSGLHMAGWHAGWLAAG